MFSGVSFHSRYEITSPVFQEVEIKLDQRFYTGKTFKIIAYNKSSENIYIQSVALNSKKINRLWITHDEITEGGVLEMYMDKKPLLVK